MFKVGNLLLGKYELQKELGVGGFGLVFKAQDKFLSRPCAIKIIRPDIIVGMGKYEVDSFIAEASTVASLDDHPSIVSIYSLDAVPHPTVPGLVIPFLVMSLATETLQDKLKLGVIDPVELAPYVTDICSGLDYAHDNGVLHLDIKPANILIGSMKQAQVSDFGLAQLLRGATSKIKVANPAGTLAYMPPEQLYGEDVTFASDVYATALTIHTLLTNKIAQIWQPWPLTALTKRKLNFDSSLSSKIRQVLEKATELDAADRYQSAGELAQAYVHAVDPNATSKTFSIKVAPPPKPIPLTTIDDEGADALLDAMRELGQYADDNKTTLNERELVTYCFKEAGLFSCLGFGDPGTDVALERGNADVVLKAAGGRPIAIIEFKKPSVVPTAGLKQLEEKYVIQQLPDAGVLCNGVDLIIYRRHQNGLLKPPVAKIRLRDADLEDAKRVYRWMGKWTLDFKQFSQFERALTAYLDSPIKVDDANQAGGIAFINRFELTTGTAFGRLVETMAETLPIMIQKSNFAKGAYNFWRKIYAREMKRSDAPKSWEALLHDKSKEGLYRFMFALESAYALLSRLMLAKVMEDKAFDLPVSLSEQFLNTLKGQMRGNKLEYKGYAKATESLLQYTGNQAFHAIFASDIFDWWFDINRLKGDVTLGERIGEAVLAIFAFDFTNLDGDLLGELYQSYFDPESRRALGEFYTSPEIVDFILDQVGYTANNQLLTTKRILDPACGSGTFLVRALRRYLQASEGQPAKQVIETLLKGLTVVGFDVNPFAVLMAQINYAAHIIPLYSKALTEDGDHTQLTKLPIPVFRTDSLRQEYREGEGTNIGSVKKDESVQLTLELKVTQSEDVSIIHAELPVEVSKGTYFQAKIPVPRYDTARAKYGVGNAEEYFTALRVLFEVVDGGNQADLEELSQALRDAGFKSNADDLAKFMEGAMLELLDQLKVLKEKYDDGRFLKTLADLALALILKSEIQYDCIVGNPPYIRVQKIPEMIRNRWEHWYNWAEGSFDAYIPFIERGMMVVAREGVHQTSWLKPGGMMSYIVPNRFLLANYASTLREKWLDYGDIRLLVDFRDSRMFKDALNYPAIFVAQRLRQGQKAREAFPAVRVHNAPPLKKSVSDVAAPILAACRDAIMRVERGEAYVDGEIVDGFLSDKDFLESERWIFMPEHEQAVFRKIESATTKRLKDLTATNSGAFQGIATGDDSSLIFKLVEDRGDTMIVQPKGYLSDPANWSNFEHVEIESAALRKWLFGRDVSRWKIKWNGWYVLYPYSMITAMEPAGNGNYVPATKLRLMPNRASIDTFAKRNKYVFQDDPDAPEAVVIPPFIDEEFPLEWKYLNRLKVEQRLRARENGKFKADKPNGHQWYAPSYPRSLQHYSKPKLLMQGLSQTSDAVADNNGYVFAASGAGQAYGLVIDETQLSSYLLVALLNSKCLEYFLKHISTIYSGKTYSYGDQFIKQLPIKLPSTTGDRTLADQIEQQAIALTASHQSLAELNEQIAQFPIPQLGKMNVDIFPFTRTIKGEIVANQLRVDRVIFEPALDGTVMMKVGKTKLFLPHQAFADMVEAWLSVQPRATILAEDLEALKLPIDPYACQALVDTLNHLKMERGSLLHNGIVVDEARLNSLVADYYGLNNDDVRVIDRFLTRF